jgi:hypothetical protein
MPKDTGNWKTRRVTLVASDSYHRIHLIQVRMPVRVKSQTVLDTTYEGPIAALWEATKDRPEIAKFGVHEGDLDLVGALFASEDMLYAGRINWLEQSETPVMREAGAEYLTTTLIEEEV